MIQLTGDDFEKLNELDQIALVKALEFQTNALPHQLIPKKTKAGKHFDEYLISAGRGAGKQISLSTPIMTSIGWKKFGELNLGDKVFDECGNLCNVIQLHPVQMPINLYRIQFDDGSHIDACEDHQWAALDEIENVDLDWASRAKILQTRQLRIGSYIPLSQALQFPESSLPIDPWLFGFWYVGNTPNCGSVEVYKNSGYAKSIYEKINGLDYIFEMGAEYGEFQVVDIPKLNVELIKNDLLNRLDIPPHYLQASASQRLELLQGICDSVHCDFDFDDAGHVILILSNTTAVSSVYELLMSLGQKPIVFDHLFIKWKPVNSIPFQLPFRVEIQRKEKVLAKDKVRTITEILKIESQLSRCISVDSSNKMYLIGRHLIPTHNTHLAIQYTWQRLWFIPKSRACIVSGTHLDLTQTIINGPSGIVENVPRELIHSFHRQEMTYRFKNGSSLVLRSAESPERIRGLNLHFAVCDEVAGWHRTTADLAYRLLRLAVRLENKEYGSKPQILITSTPKATSLFNHWRKKFLSGDPRIIIAHASSYDNPHVSADFQRTLGELDAESPFARMEVYGELIDPSEGAIFPSEKFRLWPASKPFPKFLHLCISFDTAFTEKSLIGSDSDSSSTGCTVGGIFEKDDENHLMILEGWEAKVAFPDLQEMVVDAYEKTYGKSEEFSGGKRPDIILIEDAASGKSLIQVLAKMNLPVMPAKPKEDKISRAVVATPILWEGKCWIVGSSSHKGKPAKYLEDWLFQVSTFPHTPRDMSTTNATSASNASSGKSPMDMVDSFTHLVKFYMDLNMLQSKHLVTRWNNYKRNNFEPRVNPYSV